LWDRFGWGPKDTEDISFVKMRQIFLVLSQQQTSRDAVENLGPPSEEKERKMMSKGLREKQVNLRPSVDNPKKTENKEQKPKK
jgi:hypothetical protein